MYHHRQSVVDARISHIHPHTRTRQVLVVDRNGYYGGEAASLNLTDLYKKFMNGESPQADFFAHIGGASGPAADRDFNVDLVPKFIMAHGNLVKILLHTKATRYLDFKAVEGSYVVKKGTVCKIPVTGTEVLASGLMTLFEKRRFRNFLLYMADYDESEPATHKVKLYFVPRLADLIGPHIDNSFIAFHAFRLFAMCHAPSKRF